MANMVEDLECLCHMMKTVGRRLDHDKAKVSHCVSLQRTTCVGVRMRQNLLFAVRHGVHTMYMYMFVISRMVDQ